MRFAWIRNTNSLKCEQARATGACVCCAGCTAEKARKKRRPRASMKTSWATDGFSDLTPHAGEKGTL